jgi:hypothetical protein
VRPAAVLRRVDITIPTTHGDAHPTKNRHGCDCKKKSVSLEYGRTVWANSALVMYL